MIISISGQQNVVKLAHLISEEAENNKYYVKYVFRKGFEKLYKTIKETISNNVTDLFYLKSTQRALEHWKSTPGVLQGHTMDSGT